MGDLNGVFVAKKEDVKNLIESKIEIYFGEVLGKHSEIYGAIEESDLTMTSDNPETVSMFEANKLSSGFDPFCYPVLQRSMTALGLEEIDDEYPEEALERWLKIQPQKTE